MSRRTVIVAATLVVLLGALMLSSGAIRDGSPPPDRPDRRSGVAVPEAAGGADDPAGDEGEAPSGEEERIVRGRVVTGEEDPTPVPGARVLVFEAPPYGEDDRWLPSKDGPAPASTVAECDAGEDGEFAARLPANLDPVWLVVRARGFREGYGEEYDPGEEVWIRLEKDSPATWRVEDTGENPIEGADVLVYGRRADGLPRVSLRTDHRGRFQASVGESEVILVRKTGYAPARWTDHFGPRNRLVVLCPGFPLAGRVADTQGRPVDGARVTLFAGLWQARRVTGADGRFAFGGLRGDGSPQLEVTASGFVATQWLDVSPGGEDITVVLQRPEELPPTGRVTVRVVLPHKVAATRTRFGLVRLPGREIPRGYDLDEVYMAGARGFVLTGLQPGEYEIFVEYGVVESIPLQTVKKLVPRYRGTARMRVEAGKGAPLLTLKAEDIGRSYACVRVLDAAGKPAGHVRLHCETLGLGRFTKNHHWYTRPSGRIVAAVDAPPGRRLTYTAYPYGLHGVATTAEVVTVASTDGPFTDLTLEPGALVSIRVLDSEGENLPTEPGLRVEVEQGGFPEWRMGPSQVYSGPGRSGPFDVRLLPDRPFRVRAHTRDHASRLTAFPPPGPGRHEIEIRLADTGSLSGKLRTPRGSPPGEIDIEVLNADGRIVTLTLEAGDEGAFRITGLPAGRSTLVAESRGRFLVASRDVVLSAGEALNLGEVAMRPMARVRGTVLGVDGRPAGGVVIEMREANERKVRERTVSRMDGSFDLPRPHCARPLLVGRRLDGSARALVLLAEGKVPERFTVRLRTTSEVLARFEPPVEVRLDWPSLRVETADGVRCDLSSSRVMTADHRLAGYRITDLPAGDLVLRFEGRLVDGRAMAAGARISVKPGESAETILR